jgi:protein O-mannosyl-transferase
MGKVTKSIKKSGSNVLSISREELQHTLPAIILVIAATLIAYWPSLWHDFVNWDDPYYVYKNESIRKLNANTIKHLFSTDTIVMGNWHPITMLTLAVDYAFWGNDPFGYHLTNLILHILASMGAGILVIQLFENKGMALFTALAFALHPLHIESVAWITERKDVLFTLFYFLAWITWNKSPKHKGWYALSLLLFALSAMSKAMAVTLPVILICTEYLKHRNIPWVKVLPFFILSFIFGFIGINAQRSAEALKYHIDFGLWDNMQIAGYGVWFYAGKLIWPMQLSAFYPYPVKVDGSLPLPFLVACITSLLLVLSVGVLVYMEKRVVAFCLAFFLITIFPVIQLIPLGEAMAADRYMYLSSWSCFILLYLVFQYFVQKYSVLRYPFVILACAVILFWGYRVRERLPAWASGKALWEDVIAQYPDQYFAWNNLGTLYYDKQDYEQAIPIFRKVLEMNPKYKDGHNNLGTIYALRNALDSAIYHFELAVALDSQYTAAIFNLGYAYGLKGRSDESVVLLIKAAQNGHENARVILKNNNIPW